MPPFIDFDNGICLCKDCKNFELCNAIVKQINPDEFQNVANDGVSSHISCNFEPKQWIDALFETLMGKFAKGKKERT